MYIHEITASRQLMSQAHFFVLLVINIIINKDSTVKLTKTTRFAPPSERTAQKSSPVFSLFFQEISISALGTARIIPGERADLVPHVSIPSPATLTLTPCEPSERNHPAFTTGTRVSASNITILRYSTLNVFWYSVWCQWCRPVSAGLNPQTVRWTASSLSPATELHTSGILVNPCRDPTCLRKASTHSNHLRSLS